MSQKELNYLEDIYNHENLISNVIYENIDLLSDEKYEKLLNKQNDVHASSMKKIIKMLEDEVNGK